MGEEAVKPFDPIAYAVQLGKVVEGWRLEDYLINAALNNRYETVIIWATQGDFKSSFLLYLMYLIFDDWDLVLRNIVFTPRDLVNKLKQIPPSERLVCLGWDDIGANYTVMSYKTEVEVYDAIDRAFQTIRTKVSVVLGTIANLDRLPRNLKDNLTMEVYMSRPLEPERSDQAYYMVQRWLRLVSFYEQKSYFTKVMVEEGYYDKGLVPSDVWREYWERRLELSDQTVKQLDEALAEQGEGIDLNEWMHIGEAIMYLGTSLSEAYKLHSSKAVRSVKTPQGIYFHREDLERYRHHLNYIRSTSAYRRIRRGERGNR